MVYLEDVEDCKTIQKLHLVVCGGECVKVYFFHKMEFKFSKNREKYKKNSKNSKKIKNENGVMYCFKQR